VVAEPGLPGWFGLASTDKVGLIYATGRGGVKFAASRNGGLTFANNVVAPDHAGIDTARSFPVVADAGNGSLVAVWLEVGSATEVKINFSSNFGTTWGAPHTLVSSAAGTSVFPWVAAAGSKISVSLYHSPDVTTPDMAPVGAQWFESYLESTDAGRTFSPLTMIDTTPSKTGPVCTHGLLCVSDGQLGSFQSVTLDPSGAAYVAYDRVVSQGDTQTMCSTQNTLMPDC
jgi:hypothetical protein